MQLNSFSAKNISRLEPPCDSHFPRMKNKSTRQQNFNYFFIFERKTFLFFIRQSESEVKKATKAVSNFYVYHSGVCRALWKTQQSGDGSESEKKKFSDFLLLFSTPIFYVRIFISSQPSILKKWVLYNSTRRRCIQARKQKEKIINRLQEIV